MTVERDTDIQAAIKAAEADISIPSNTLPAAGVTAEKPTGEPDAESETPAPDAGKGGADALREKAQTGKEVADPGKTEEKSPTDSKETKASEQATGDDETKPPPESARERLSKRDEFNELARKESEDRKRETDLKGREQTAQEAISRMEAFDKDPIGYMEQKNPNALRDWIKRINDGGETPEALHSKQVETRIEKMEREHKEAMEGITRRHNEQNAVEYMRAVDQELSSEAMKDAEIYAKLHHALTGHKVDREKQATSIYREYSEAYSKHLTPRETAAIIYEDDARRLDTARKDPALIEFFGGTTKQADPDKDADPAPKPTEKKPSKTLTNDLETGGDTPTPDDFMKLDREEQIRQAAKAIQWGQTEQ